MQFLRHYQRRQMDILFIDFSIAINHVVSLLNLQPTICTLHFLTVCLLDGEWIEGCCWNWPDCELSGIARGSMVHTEHLDTRVPFSRNHLSVHHHTEIESEFGWEMWIIRWQNRQISTYNHGIHDILVEDLLPWHALVFNSHVPSHLVDDFTYIYSFTFYKSKIVCRQQLECAIPNQLTTNDIIS